MGYTHEQWINRLSERSDLSTSVVHLTRKTNEQTLIDVLLKILQDKKLVGSTTDSGFIVGSTPAVCFQDAPLNSIAQNIWFEQKYRKTNKSAKLRYLACGLSFKKPYAYNKGARPVIYEQTSVAKNFLPSKEWWRIVNYDLLDKASYVDWTHEREWRCPNNFHFALSETTVILPNKNAYKKFIEDCETQSLDFYKKVKGIVMMQALFF